MPVLPRQLGEAPTLRELFEHAVRTHAKRVAMVHQRAADAGLWKYKEVHEYVRKFSGALLDMGVTKGDRIAILSDNRPGWGVAFFTIASIGAVAVPLDRNQSPEEITELLNQSGAKLVVAPAAVTESFSRVFAAVPEIQAILSMEDPRSKGMIIGWEDMLERGARSGRDYHEVSVGPQDLLCLTFTPGTTGPVKGVLLSHGNVAFALGALHRVNPYASSDNLLSLLPMNNLYEFLFGFLMPFFCGGQIVYLSEPQPTAITAAFRKWGVTRIVGAPLLVAMLFRDVAERLEKLSSVQKFLFFRSLDIARSMKTLTGTVPKLFLGDAQREFGGKIRQIVLGGAATSPEMIDRIADAGFPLAVSYGLVEATGACTFGLVGAIPAGSLGKPIPGVMMTAESGGADEPGEIVVEGSNLAKRYLGDADTAPVELKDGRLLTGDLGRFDATGHLFLHGRQSEIIAAARGRRVFPADIERHYAAIPFVREFAVISKGRPDGQTEALGVVVADSEDPAAPRDLKVLEETIRTAFVNRTKTVPPFEWVKNVVFTDGPIPKTSSMTVKRWELVRRLENRDGVASGIYKLKRKRAAKPGGPESSSPA